MQVAIIGCGLIGRKRAQFLNSCRLRVCVDLIFERAQAMANMHDGCIALKTWNEAITQKDVDIVIVATQHAELAKITLAAIQAGKHVFVEKPGGSNSLELDSLIRAQKEKSTLVRVGFNHRYHRAFQQARKLIAEDALGELMYIRGRYGHGGRIGYEKEWRANPSLSGGGELIDQGIHLIDLARWFLGDFTEINGHVHTYYWNMPVEDNSFLILKNPSHQIAFLHASCTEWKNLFSFEIYGKKGKLDINGLGGSYGVERLTYYKMSDAMGPPETFIWEYPMVDNSWELEFAEFIEDINNKEKSRVPLEDAHAALKIVEAIYQMNKK